jgi:hypothetical protein
MIIHQTQRIVFMGIVKLPERIYRRIIQEVQAAKAPGPV